MQNIVNIISWIIVSVGGAGVVILGISHWIGKIWANKFAEKHKVKYEKELEHYKSEINTRLNKLDKIEEKALYISKVNFDNEFKIYMEIWPKLIECINSTNWLYPRGIENVPIDKEELEEYKKEKYNDFRKNYIAFSECMEKYAPFYLEDFYRDLSKIKEICFSIGDQFKMYEFDVKYNQSFVACRDLKMSAKEYKETSKKQEELSKLKENLLTKIRTYLNELKLK